MRKKLTRFDFDLPLDIGIADAVIVLTEKSPADAVRAAIVKDYRESEGG